MLLSEFNQYDLTGSNSEFKVEDRRKVIFDANQEVDFGEAVYGSSIQVYKFDTNGVRVPISNWSYDGTYSALCKDVSAMSDAKVRYNRAPYQLTEDTVSLSGKKYYYYDNVSEQFVEAETSVNNPKGYGYYEKIVRPWNSILVNKIYITDNTTPEQEYEISIDYQVLKRPYTSINKDEDGPMYSPGLMKSLIEKVDELMATRISVDNVVSSASNLFISMKEDLTGNAPENYVENEDHVINVQENKYVVRPYAGSFYKDGLSIVYDNGSISRTLVEETGDGSGDYEVIGVNKAKTAISDPKGGVFEFIVFKKPFVGRVFVSYHAFGGEVSSKDLSAIQDNLVSLQESLSNKQLLTVSTLNKAAIIANIIDRIDYIEHSIQHYKSIGFKYTPSSEKDKWFDVAYIPAHPWSYDADLLKSDIGKFEILIEERECSIDVNLSYICDVDANTVSKAELRVFDNGKVSMQTDVKLGENWNISRIVPKFRVVTGASSSGAIKYSNGLMLQMAITSRDVETCTIRVTDKTSAKSPWVLVDSADEERADSSISTIFPNGAIWNSSNSGSIISNKCSIYGCGYTIYNGVAPISLLNNYTLPLMTSCSTDVVLTEIRELQLIIYDRAKDEYIKVKSDRISIDTDSVSAHIEYYLDDMCSLSVKVTNSEIICNACTGTNSLSTNRFLLSKIIIK